MKVAATLPSKDLIQKNKTKVALRETANKKLAEHVANKPKLGFPSPLAEWIKREDIRADIQFAFHTDFAKTYFNQRSEEHTSELQSRFDLVCRLLLERYRYHRNLHSFPTRRSSDLPEK